MRAPAKIGLVCAGYVGALVVATAVVAVYIAATSGADRQTSAAMFDFGDSILFLAVFAGAAVAPTGIALYFLRPYPVFWVALAVAALAVAGTAAAASFFYLAAQGAGPGSIAHAWSAAAVLRILIAPVLALAFLVSAVMTPSRWPRFALLAAAVIEAAAFACAAFGVLLGLARLRA